MRIVLKISVEEIRGYCPVFKKKDIITIDDPRIVLDKTDALCTHALSTILHYCTILDKHWCPQQLGLTTGDNPNFAFFQCVDPGKPYTDGGTVIFKCEKLEG